METPIVKLSEDDLIDVYEPSEDSFLLIDALENDLSKIKSLKPSMCLEIGIGSGVVLTALAVALKKNNKSYFLGCDINPKACKVSKKTSVNNQTNIDIVQMNLTESLLTKNIFDIIIFNPPYVVTESLEVFDEKLISKAWAGGLKGREVMDKLFPYIHQILSENGLFYLLLIKENEPQEIIELFNKNYKMNGLIVIERKIRGEHLFVVRFCKNM